MEIDIFFKGMTSLL